MTSADSLRARLRALPEPEWARWPDDTSFGVGREDEAGLIALATDFELIDAGVDDPDCWVPIHAWRALGVLRSERAVGPLLDIFGEIEADDWMVQDFPTVFGRIGAAAVPALRALGTDTRAEDYRRMSAAEALGRIALLHHDRVDACVEALTAMLEGFRQQSDELNAMVIGSLVDLQVSEAAPLMEAAFGAGRVDLMFMGDWEDVQIELGLLEERVSPRPPGAPTWDPDQDFDDPRLPGWRDLSPEGAEALGRVLGAPEADLPIRSLRALEGFLFTVACVPELVPPSAWIAFLLADGLEVADEDEGHDIIRPLLELYNGIQTAVNELPFLPPEGFFRDDVTSNWDSDADACLWARGFVVGHHWLEEAWTVEADEDEALGSLLATLSFFASRKVAEGFVEASSDPDLSVEEMAEMVRLSWPDAAVGYAEIGAALASRRMRERRRPARASAESRTGRNEPCPCGSGRKFKKCCGRVRTEGRSGFSFR